MAEEELDTCSLCGLPKAWCRDNENNPRARFDVATERCWATYRVAQRQEKEAKEKKEAPAQRADIVSPRFRDGVEPDITAGLGINLPEGG